MRSRSLFTFSCRRFLVGAALFLLGAGVAPILLAAPMCMENGGDYVGCVKPAGLRWQVELSGSDLDGTQHMTREGALRATAAAAIQSMTNPENYNRGLQTGPFTFSSINSSCVVTGTNTDTSFTDLSIYPLIGNSSHVHLSYTVHYYGEKPHPTCPGQKVIYSSNRGTVKGYPICPPGYRANSEYSATSLANHGFMCVPGESTETRLSQVVKNTELSCQDTVGSAGQSKTSMPVNIATRCKSQAERDIQTPGPWPIGWDRYIAQDSEREGWRMAEVGNLVTANRSDGFTWAVLRRPWGQFLAFKASPMSSGPRTWNVAMEGPQLFQSRLQDHWVSGTLSHWTLHQANGETETYDASGKLIRRTSADGFNHHIGYDSQGRMVSIRDDFNHALEVSYAPQNGYTESGSYTWEDDLGNPVTGGSSYALSWQGPMGQQLPESVSDGTRMVGYVWSVSPAGSRPDANARLSKVIWNDGTERTYVYGETVNGKPMGSSAMSGELDEEGRRVRTYEPTSSNALTILREWKGAGPDGVGALERLTINTSSLVDQDGRTFSFSKGGTSTFSSNRIRTYSTPCPECGGTQGSTLTYDSNGFLTQIKDWRNTTTVLAYDTAGRITSTTEANGTALARTVAFTYPTDPALRDPLTKTEPVIDATGTSRTRTTTYTYTMVPVTYPTGSPCASSPAVTCPTQARKLTSVTVSVNDGSPNRTWSFAYNTLGLMDTMTGPDGVVTKWTWTADGQAATVTQGHGTSLAQTTTFGGHGVWGPTWQQSPNGLVTRWSFDLRGRIYREQTGVPGPGGIGSADNEGNWSTSDGAWRTSSFVWRDNGLLDTAILPDSTSMTFTYDGADRPLTVTAKTSTNAVMWSREMSWSAAGMLLSTTTKNAAGSTVLTSSQTYNALQDIASVVDSRSQATTLGYDANGMLTSTENPLAHRNSRTLDILGRPTTLTDALNQTANVTYGPQDEVRTATDQRSITTTYAYNGFGDLVSLQSPDRGTWTFGYDAAGRLTTTTDPRGVVVTTAYDALSRPATRTFSDAGVFGAPAGFTAGNVTHGFTYDECTNGTGRLCSFSDATGTTAYSYNAWGQVTGKSWTGKAGGPQAGITLSTGYAYDAASGRLTTVTLPSGKIMNLVYGTDGRIATVGYNGQPVVANVQWTAFDAIAGWAWPQAVGWSGVHSNVAFSYDQDGRPTGIEDLDERSLVWDNGNRLVGVDDPNDVTKSQIYGYDSLDRLTSADIGGWGGPIAFTYDSVGNRTSINDTVTNYGWAYAYGTDHNRLLQRWSMTSGTPGMPVPLTYDTMGNMVSDGLGMSLSYDVTGRLVQASKGGAAFTAGYNALGQRVVKTSSGSSASGTRLYALDEIGRPLGVYVVDSSASNGYRVEEEYIHLDGWRPVAVVRPDAATGMANPKIFPILTDHLGTPRKVLDGDTGETRWAWDAKQPFGHELPNETPTTGQPAFAFDLRFPGQRYDGETGLFHNGFRDYHPGLGRYVQSDPLGLVAGWNTYGYAGQSPLLYGDVYGLWFGVDDAIFAGGGALIGMGGRFVGDLVTGNKSTWEDYVGAAVGGAVGGEILLYTANPFLAGAGSGLASNVTTQGLKWMKGKQCGMDFSSALFDTSFGAITGVIPGPKIIGVTQGRGSNIQVFRLIRTRAQNGTIDRITTKTAFKMADGAFWEYGLIPGASASAAASPIYGHITK